MDNLESLEEGLHVELKEAKGGVPQSLYETLSAFANTDGGDIYLGIKENKVKPNDAMGIHDYAQYKKDILNAVNNRQKISSPVLNDSSFKDIKTSDGKTIMAIHVDEEDRRRKPVYLNGNLANSYKRADDGDHLFLPEDLKACLNDNSTEAFDSLPNSRGYGIESVNTETLKEYRRLLNENASDNIYQAMGDEEFLKATASLLSNDKGQLVLTNAAAILFTTGPLISTIFPFYSLDYTKNVSGRDKWDARISSDDVTWSGNLFDFYRKVSSALAADLPSAYVFGEGRNMGPSLMQNAINEALCNAFSNHTFFLNGPLKVYRNLNSLSIENNGKSLLPLSQVYSGGISRPRNPGIIAAFRRIGVADRAGTGVPRMIQALLANHFPRPIFTESGYPTDKTSLFISFVSVKDVPQWSEKKERIVTCLQSHPNGISVSDTVSITNLSRAYVSLTLNQMVRSGNAKDNGKQTKGKLYFLSNKQ